MHLRFLITSAGLKEKRKDWKVLNCPYIRRLWQFYTLIHFGLHVTAITVVTVDCLRGRYEFDAVKIAHDFGKSMNTPVDRGQVEGAAVQGLGWMTMEEKSIDS